MDHGDSTLLHHGPCSACGSRDNCGTYSDGHTYCFGCGAYTPGDGGPPKQSSKRKVVSGAPLIEDIEIRRLEARSISEETCRHFKYGYGEYKGKQVQVAPYFDAEGRLVAQKVRGKDKAFTVTGDINEALPFGAHAWPKSGRTLVVTEGEIDALSMSQVQGNKYPVVSIACGAGPQVRKYIGKHLDYFRGFEKVVLMFDSDEPGQRAAQDAAEIIGRTAHIASLPLKDANEMLVAGRTGELITAFFQAKQWRPEGIVELSTLKERAKSRPTRGIPWWSDKLTELTYGIRDGELIAIGAGTGVGKTDVITQQVAFMAEAGHSVGVFALEQMVTETAIRLAGKVAKRPLHIPDKWDEGLFDTAWDTLTRSKGKVYLYESFGVNEWDSIKSKIEYLAHAEGVKFFVLDHLTALAAAEEDERKGLERIMADMGGLVKKLGCTIIFVSHLSTPEGKSHEEGGHVSLKHMKGSRAIGYWCSFAIGLERDQQADDENVRTTTTVRILKDRYTGAATGQTFHLGYDRETGMLFETVAPEERASAFPAEPGSTTTPNEF